jgi:predicted O-linked N-acetylglucosamine transferase (SPINDLY family)
VVDATTERIKSCVDSWVQCEALTDDGLAKRIRQDAIDVLVDLSSHTEGNRLLTFARRPAPVQVSWFGFPVSTGLQTIQYRLTDSMLDPPGESERFYSEQLVRLDRFYAAFRPDQRAPAIADAPVNRNGFVTFASLNSWAKVTLPMLELWADMLRDLPGSRLLLQAAGLEDADLADSVRKLFAQRGVESQRLLICGWSHMDEFLHLGEEVDIALDPFPFNGGVTTCHALWMGLPVVTMRGESAASRVGTSIMAHIGLADLIAADADSYRSIAVGLAKNRARLTELRASLRVRMESGGLLDGVGLAEQAAAAYRNMWRNWCATQ